MHSMQKKIQKMRASFSQLFQKFVQFPQSPTFFLKFISKYFAPQPLKNVQTFNKSSIQSLSLKPMLT